MKIIGCCAYFADRLIHDITSALQASGVELHLWALQNAPANLASVTRGVGMQPKWTIMTRLMSSIPPDFDYVLFFDDDIILAPNFVRDFFPIVQRMGAELAQPALTRDSFFSHQITLQDPTATARMTNFVESGPLVCMTRRFYELAQPYHDPISPLGWGYEAAWSDLGQKHALPLAIIDRCPVRHTRPVGHTYSMQTATQEMQSYCRKYGTEMPQKRVLYWMP